MRKENISKSKKKTKTHKIQQEQNESSDQSLDQDQDYFTLRQKKTKKANTNTQQEQSVTLLSKYNNQNYRKYINYIKELYEVERTQGLMFKKYQQSQLQKLIYMGDNLCFYGYGSKRQFLSGMRERFFSEKYCWEVKGYLPTISVKKIYNNFGQFLKAAGVIKKVSSITMADQIKQYRQKIFEYTSKNPNNSEKLIVLFHCLDGINLMTIQNQRYLSQLFSLKGIRFLCTFDNIKIIMLWSPRLKQNFKFLFYKIETNIPSTQQQMVRPNPNEKTDRTQKRIMNIIQSLNANQKRILKIIAKNQLENINKDCPSHYTVSELLQLCIDQVILSNDTQLRQNLLQLLDHQVIQQKEQPLRNKKVLTMKLQKKLLQKICDMHVI